MNEIERKKLQLELKKVDCGKDELELRVFERLAEIERLKESIAVSEKRIEEIKLLLGE